MDGSAVGTGPLPNRQEHGGDDEAAPAAALGTGCEPIDGQQVLAGPVALILHRQALGQSCFIAFKGRR